jgi:hypothetical protein
VQPSFQCKAISLITIQLYCSTADSQSHNRTERSGCPSAHHTVPDIVLLSSEQTGFVECTAAEGLRANREMLGAIQTQ